MKLPGLAQLALLLALAACRPDSADEHDDHQEHDEPADHVDDHDDHDDRDDPDDTQVITLSPAARERSGIRVEPAAAGSLGSAVDAPAEVQLNPDRVAHISPLVDGQLTRVEVTVGDHVEPEQELGELRSVELGQARAELSRASALRDVAEQNFERQQRLRSEGISSERSLLEAELAFEEADAERDAARSRLRVFGARGGSGADMTLTSPIEGRVIERHATQGENVSPSDTLFVVADLSTVWVIGRVYEQDVARVHDQMVATLMLDAYPSRSWTGSVTWVGSALDPHTRTLPVRVVLDNPEGHLRPGLFGQLRLEPPVGGERQVAVVPSEAVQTLHGRSVVFVPGDESGQFRAVPVVTGVSNELGAEPRVEIIEGIEPGDEVVVSGAFVLKSELLRGELGHGHAH